MKIPVIDRTKLNSILYLRSFRLRICLLILAVGIVPGILLQRAVLRTYEKHAVEQRSAIVQNQLLVVAKHLISNNYFGNYPGEKANWTTMGQVINAELDTISDLYEGRVMIIGKGCRVLKDTYGISEGKTIISEEVIKCFQGENMSHYDAEHGFIEMTTPIVFTAEDGKSEVMGVLLTSVSNNRIEEMMEVLNRKAINLLAIIIVLVIASAPVLSGILTKPFKKVTDEIGKVKDGLSEQAISVPDYAETVHIVDAFNTILSRMKALNDSRQEFVANVSHELKTPMTSIKVLADSLLAQENVPADLYREFMEDMVSEIDRENRIITDLLSLVKMDNKVQSLNIASVNINDLAELTLKRLRPLARKKDIELVFESLRPVVAEVDEVKLTIILTNLVENAIKYNREHGWVKVLLDADHQYFTVKVSDSGVGIPEEALPHIFERFYRVDKSHSREMGGTGLGLALTRSAILLHKGTVVADSIPDEGTTFTVKIPLIYIP